MEHIHKWSRDNSRKHGRPPRYFVKCTCGASAQAVDCFGHRHVFQTSKPGDQRELKQVRSIRLSDHEIELIERGQLRLKIRGGRITVAV